MVVKGAAALEVWSRRVTEGYPGVRIVNMSSSWRDGLAFLAIIHRFRPDLVEWDKIDAGQIQRWVVCLVDSELGTWGIFL